MAKKQKKGQQGKNTGATTRRAIIAAKNRGLTASDIGRATNRDPSTIADIEVGKIKNPPSGLAGQIRGIKGKPGKGKVARSKASKKRHD